MGEERPGMTRYLATRLINAIFMLFTVAVLVFFLLRLAPGDPAYVLAGEYGTTPEYLEYIREKFGLNQPLSTQLKNHLSLLIRGDLGYSFVWREPVLDIILEHIPRTVLLMLSSLTVAAIGGITLGTIAAIRPHTLLDHAATLLCLLGYSVPVFWIGLLLILLFSVQLGWFPVGGWQSIAADLTGIAYYLDIGKHLVLPTITLGFTQLALVARLTRGSMMTTLSRDYIRTARAKGLSETQVLLKHGLRNGLLPVVTILGVNLGASLGGAILTETVFSWPGLGRLVMRGLSTRDYPLIIGILLFSAAMTAVANIITDIIYGLLDPRIRYE